MSTLLNHSPKKFIYLLPAYFSDLVLEPTPSYYLLKDIGITMCLLLNAVIQLAIFFGVYNLGLLNEEEKKKKKKCSW